METKTSLLDWAKLLLLGGNALVFVVLIGQLTAPNLIFQKMVDLDLTKLSDFCNKKISPSGQVAYLRLNRINNFPKNFSTMETSKQKQCLVKWKLWWKKNRNQIHLSGFNGLIFMGVILSILGLMGLLLKIPQLWSLTVLVFCLNSIVFFLLFSQSADQSMLGKFYAFSFMVSTFTLGYLANPKMQPPLQVKQMA